MRPLSYPLLKITFVVVFFVFFTLLARHLLLLPQTFAMDRVEARTDLSGSQLKPGLQIDNLPLVKIDYGKYVPKAQVPREDPDESISLAQRRQLCTTRGYFLGAEVSSANCPEICSLDASEVEFNVVSVLDTSRIIAGRQKLRPGGYCMPTKMANCNRNTSSVVYSMFGWICLPRTDAFAGAGGNRIVVCNGKLRDNALRTVYQEFIPPNLVFTDVYRDRLADGTYRFECPRAERDTIGNLYVSSNLNRLHAIRNWCTSTVPYAANVSVDLDRGRCVCGDPLVLDKKSGMCTACHVHFDAELKQIAFTQKPCYSITDDLLSFEERVREARRSADQYPFPGLGAFTLFPCGYNTQGTDSERTLPRCLQYYASISNPPLPSYRTLQTIDSVVP